MIVHPVGDTAEIVMQVEHSTVSGELAEAWPGLEPRESVIIAATYHDIGWRSWEASPRCDPETGQPMEQPSIPPDEFEDDPMIFAGIYRDWCLVSQGDREKNPAGYANVRARGQMYQRKADMMAQAQAMAQAPGGPAGPGGPPPPPDGNSMPSPQVGGAPPPGPPQSFETGPTPDNTVHVVHH